jgi:hypothetical protein
MRKIAILAVATVVSTLGFVAVQTAGTTPQADTNWPCHICKHATR